MTSALVDPCRTAAGRAALERIRARLERRYGRPVSESESMLAARSFARLAQALAMVGTVEGDVERAP